MTRAAQEHEELQFVERMRRLRLGDPVGVLQVGDKPDVRVVSLERTVGVEVTELHQALRIGALPRRQVEAERRRMVDRACLFAQSEGIPPLDVAVHFNDRGGLGKHNREVVARSLVGLVAKNIPAVDESREIETRRDTGLIPGVRLVRIFRAEILTKHHWSVPDSGWVQTDFILELQQILDRKNTLCNVYREHCDECWLLIVASGGRPSGFFQPSAETRAHVYRSGFEKTLFLEAFAGYVVELKTTRD